MFVSVLTHVPNPFSVHWQADAVGLIKRGESFSYVEEVSVAIA